MTSIFFLIETRYSYIFRSNYLKKETYLLKLILHFLKLDSILNISKKKMTLIA